MTNYDRIKQMNIDEMANFISNDCDGVCGCCVFRRNIRCYEDEDKCKFGIKEWLEQEIETNQRKEDENGQRRF